MKKIILSALLALILLVAYVSKPDDKTCIIKAVTSVWGSLTPEVQNPAAYEQFFNVTSQSVKVEDWVFFKRVRYNFKSGYATVGIGAFKNVMTIKRLSE